VAGQDTVAYAPPVQGEPHVGTAIVHGVYPAVVEEERKRTTGDAHRHTTGGAYVVKPSSSH
jgi:hypothetical protein